MNRTPSIWLTAFVAKILDESITEVSSRFGFSADRQVVKLAVEWISKQQSNDGSFHEGEIYPDPNQAPVEFQEISVTSQVVITLAALRNLSPVSSLFRNIKFLYMIIGGTASIQPNASQLHDLAFSSTIYS